MYYNGQAVESYGLVSSRTTELECIHATSILLHQLKQFVYHKRALDAYLQNPDDSGTLISFLLTLTARHLIYSITI